MREKAARLHSDRKCTLAVFVRRFVDPGIGARPVGAGIDEAGIDEAGKALAKVLPGDDADPNELPDRVIVEDA